MHTESSSIYLERAMEVGARELDALQNGDTELALELADHRSWLISQAWNVRVEFDEKYFNKLLEVQRMQDTLTAEARRQRDAIRDSLIHSRKEGQRLAGYKKAVAYAV